MAERRRRSLDRYLSRCGIASRVEAMKMVRSGRVAVNKQVVKDPHAWVNTERDTVTVDGDRIGAPKKLKVYLYNKRRGLLVTARDPEGRPTIFDDLPEELRRAGLKPVGRLDKASGGLLLLTNHTDLATQLLESKLEIPKTYRVKLNPAPNERQIGHMRSGMRIGDRRPTAPARVTVERKNKKSSVICMVLTEGRNRQIRRMAAKVDCEVEWLVRVRFGPIDLGELQPGQLREANRGEVQALLACAGLDD